jgi:hypothetical protein
LSYRILHDLVSDAGWLYDERVKVWRTDVQTRDWISLVAALAIGPVSLIGYEIPGLIFGAAAAFYFLYCAIVVPLVTFIAGRLKFLTWQLAIISLTLTVVGDNLRLGPMPSSEIARVAFVLWTSGTLLSSPVPIYFLLRPLTWRQRCVSGVVIAAVSFALWLGLKRNTG